MSRTGAGVRAVALLLAGALLAAGCYAVSRPESVPTAKVLVPPTPMDTESPSIYTPRASASASTIPAEPQSVPASTRVSVQVRVNGYLFVRRGPDLAFNSISVLSAGQAVTPNGRDVLAKWVRIAMPGDATRTGWISIMSDVTEVSGDLRSLPEIQMRVWPELAFLRNCTYHEMVIQPGGLQVPAVQNFPHNDVRVNPGSYSVIDIEVDGYPSVMDVEIREGSAIDILIDGGGERRKCPEL